MIGDADWTHEQEYHDLDHPLAWWRYLVLLGIVAVTFGMDALYDLWPWRRHER